MIVGISYYTNIEEVRRLFEKFNKAQNNSEKIEIAFQIEPLKIPSGAFPSDWENILANQKKSNYG